MDVHLLFTIKLIVRTKEEKGYSIRSQKETTQSKESRQKEPEIPRYILINWIVPAKRVLEKEKRKHHRSFRSHPYHPRSKDLIESRRLPKQMIFISLFPFFPQGRAFINYLHELGNRIVDPIGHNLTLY